MNVGLEHYLIVSALLFSLGLLGVIVRRNVLVMLMCMELMLNGVILSLVTFAQQTGTAAGAVLVFLIFVVAAAEIAIAGNQHRMIKMRGEFHHIHRQFDIHIALERVFKGGIETLTAALVARLDDSSVTTSVSFDRIDAERRELVLLLRSLPAHMSYVLIEHDLDIALRVVDAVTVMHNGRVLRSGTPSEIESDAEVQAIYMGSKH